jgi:exodeoxyribonuclease-3
MKIISWNVNGIRSAYQKNLLGFFAKENADIVCLQEIKAQEKDLPQDILSFPGYTLLLNPAQKKGYSGVAVFTKEKPISVNSRLGLERFDKEGRILELEYSNFILINIYIPHGGRLKENLIYKLRVYKKSFQKLKRMRAKNVILIGDFNIAHKEIDLARPQQNKDNIMFTPEERKQIDALLDLGFIDSFRKFNNKSGYFTWWPYAFDARKRNMGWRIDYGFTSKGLSKNLKKATIYSKVNGSDHCPIGLELAL